MQNVSVIDAWKLLITPQRTNYSIDDLGPKTMTFTNSDSYREDFSFINQRGSKIFASLFVPLSKKMTSEQEIQMQKLKCPCLVYCHSQQGCRVEGLFLQTFCIENNIGLCLFDFAGCGKSQGEFVTLGWNETDDLNQLIEILTKDYKATQIILWGRSMGAVTSIMFAERNSFFLSSMVILIDP